MNLKINFFAKIWAFIFVLFLFSCQDISHQTSIVPREIIVADSMIYINPIKADSIYRNIINEKESSSFTKGRAFLGLAKLQDSKGHKDSVLIFYQQVENILQERSDTLLWLGYLLDKGNYFMKNYEVDSMKKYFNKGLEMATIFKNADYIQGFSISKGQLLNEEGNYKQAAEVLLAGLKSAENSGNLAHQAVALQNLALVAGQTSDYNEAIRLQKKSLNIKKQLNLMADYAEGIQNLGIYYRNLQNYDSALYCYDVAKNVMSKLGDSIGMLMVNYNRGLVLKNKGNYDEAALIFNQVLETSRRYGITAGEMYAFSALAGIYQEKGDYDKALITIDKAIEFATNKIPTKLPNFLKRKHEVLAKMNRYKESYEIMCEATLLNDSLLSIEKQKEILELKSKYETEKKNTENQKLKIEIDNKSKTIVLHRIISILGILLLLFTIIASVLRIKNITRIKNLETIKSQLLETANHAQSIKLEKMQIENQLKVEVLNKMELEKKLNEEKLQKMELEANIKVQEMIYQTLARTDLTQLLNTIKEKLLPYKLKLLRKKDQDEFLMIITEIDRYIQLNPLSEFEILFQQLHPNFFNALIEINPTFTKTELKVAAMIRLNLSTKDICRLVNLSSSTVESTRYHIRRKLNLDLGKNLTSALIHL
jgi:tetratricopeptide (TPR) repeat protein